MSKVLSSLSLASVIAAGCTCAASHNVPIDASALDGAIDAEIDAGTPTCESMGSIRLLDARLLPEDSSRPAVSLLRASAAQDGSGFFVLGYFPWETPESIGAVRRLAYFDAVGALVNDREVRRVSPSWTATADVVMREGAAWVFGTDWTGSQTELWFARSDDTTVTTGSIFVREDVERMLRGPTAVATSEGVDLYATDVGRLKRYFFDGIGLAETALDLVVDPDSRLVAAVGSRERDVCIGIRERVSGRLRLVVIQEDTIVNHEIVTDAGAPFLPVPVVTEADRTCVLPYFAPDPERPTASVVRVTSSDVALGGWGGTAPVGLAVVRGGESLLVVVHHPRLPGQTAVHWLRASAGACIVGEPALVLGAAPVAMPLGAVATVELGDTSYAVLGGLTAPGEVAIAQLEPSS